MSDQRPVNHPDFAQFAGQPGWGTWSYPVTDLQIDDLFTARGPVR